MATALQGISRIDDVHSHGKNAVLSAESFAFNHGAMQTTVEAHTDAIDSLSNNYKNLEQQVRAIARVMASQNVQKLTENLKHVGDDLRRSVLHEVNEKQKEMLARMEREVQEVMDAKTGIQKRIEGVKDHIMQNVTSKFEDAHQMRRQNREDIDKLKETMGEVPAIADRNSKLLKTLESAFSEIKNEFKTFKRQHEQTTIEQDKTTSLLATEVRTSLEGAMEKIESETKAMSKSIWKREQMFDEEVKSIKALIDKEATNRAKDLKEVRATVNDEVFKLKTDTERRCAGAELSVDHKVGPFEASVREMKHLIEEEAVHRETADKELSRCINKETQDRALDEDRLVTLIATCQSAVTKMHRGR